MRFIDEVGLSRFAAELARDRFDVYAPVEVGGHAVFRRIEPQGDERVAWNAQRMSEPLKPFWFQTGKVVARWTRDGPEAGPPMRPRAVFGVKACDIKSLRVIDAVFRDHEYQEPNWCAAREHNVIIAGDCTACAESCFCSMLGDEPFPQADYDLCVSPVEDGYLVEVGSEVGEALVHDHAALFGESTPAQLAARDAVRERVRQDVREQNEPYAVHDPFAKSVDKNLKTRLWGKLASTCVECNACNMVCPTCHCFMLHAVPTPEGSQRVCTWDSCFQAGYARMAGGGTPRLQLVERFKNHYQHKFSAFPRNWGVTACSGCGRCIDACMGRIDKRECLHRLETEWLPSEVLEDLP